MVPVAVPPLDAVHVPLAPDRAALGALHHVRAPQPEPDQRVQHGDQGHRRYEEDHRRDGERVVDDHVLRVAHHALRVAGNGREDLQLEDEGYGAADGDQPYEEDQFHGPVQLGHGVREERVADGDVALHREGGYGEDGGVRRRLREEAVQDAEGLTEDVRVFRPDRVHLLWERNYV